MPSQKTLDALADAREKNEVAAHLSADGKFTPVAPPAARPPNPKDIHGFKKVDLSLIPDIAVFHGAHAFVDGAIKYGPYNWRDNAVLARVYIAAAQRHLAYWAAGQETAADSEVHHLGHAIACLAILLDAQATGNLIDNRAKSEKLIEAMEAMNEIVKRRGTQKAPAPASK